MLGVMVAVSALLLLLAIALEPQANAFGGGQWWSWIFAFTAVLFEALVLSLLLLKVLHSKTKKYIFVETMKTENKWSPEMSEPSMLSDINCCKIYTFVAVVTFPLNIIPVAGTVLYSFINAPYTAWDYMDMYFDTIQMDIKAQKIEVLGNNSMLSPKVYGSKYVRFGFTCTLLEMIPILGPAVFALTNACGAALWACNMEKHGTHSKLSQAFVLDQHLVD